MIFIGVDMLIDGRTNSCHFRPSSPAEGPNSGVFAQHSAPGPVFYTAGIVTVRIFACGRFPQGQDESAGFPGYNARDILESFTGEKLLPS